MKKALLWMVLAMGIAVACTQQKPKTTATGSSVKTDSVGCVIKKQGIEIAISTDYPTEAEALQQGLSAFIVEQMVLDDSLDIFPTADGQQVMQLLAEAKFKDIKSMLGEQEDGEAAQAEKADASSNYKADYKRVYETDDYISFQGYWNSYVEGTAHPNDGYCGITLRKNDGKPLGLTDILKSTDGPKFREQLKEGIKKWLFDITESESMTDEDMKQILGEQFTPDSIPLPESAPFLLEEGIALPYASYELLPQASGIIVIPYDADYSFLKP